MSHDYPERHLRALVVLSITGPASTDTPVF